MNLVTTQDSVARQKKKNEPQVLNADDDDEIEPLQQDPNMKFETGIVSDGVSQMGKKKKKKKKKKNADRDGETEETMLTDPANQEAIQKTREEMKALEEENQRLIQEEQRIEELKRRKEQDIIQNERRKSSQDMKAQQE